MSAMSAKVFIDSNVFLYAVEEQDPVKAARAAEWLRHLLESGVGVANMQVMNEVTNVLFKRARLPAEKVFELIDGYAGFGARPINEETVLAARLVRFETGYSWWDCVLLASAMELGCNQFLTEDLRDGHAVRGLTILNPFRHSPPQLSLH
jgi:predicted nucleic acid-binding protein